MLILQRGVGDAAITDVIEGEALTKMVVVDEMNS